MSVRWWLAGRWWPGAGMPSAEAHDVVLVTGASTGLGLALARLLLAKTEYRLILTARAGSMGRFAEAGITESDRVWLRPLDVTDDGQRRAVVREAEQRWGGVDVLVNNAGVAYRSVGEHVNEAEWLAQVNVNFRAPLALTNLVLPGMRRRRHGRIVNISSVGGMMAMPTMSLYSASKFALEGAVEALWYEVRPWGIHVSLLQPGFINSDSFENTRYTLASRRSEQDVDDAYHNHYVHMAGFIRQVMRLTWSTPDDVARSVLSVMRSPRPPLRVAATLDAHLFALVRRLLPRGLYHELLYRLLPHIEDWGPGRGRRLRTADEEVTAGFQRPGVPPPPGSASGRLSGG